MRRCQTALLLLCAAALAAGVAPSFVTDWVVAPGEPDSIAWTRDLDPYATSWLAGQASGSIVVVRVGMVDAAGALQFPTCDAGCARSRLFGPRPSVASYFAEVCGFVFQEAASTVLSVPTTLTAAAVASPRGMCDMSAVSAAAAAAVQAAGRTPTFLMVMLPKVASYGACVPFAGLGVLGCVAGNCVTWLFNGADTNTYIHELGHNFGLNHASVDADNDGVTDVNTVTGATAEYGDDSDPMGTPISSGGPRVHAVHLFRLRRLVLGTPALVRLANNATLTLEVWSASALPAAQQGAGAPALLRLVLMEGVAESWWVSVRTAPAGTFDAQLPPKLAPVVYIHRHRFAGDVTRLVTRLTVPDAVWADRDGSMRVRVLSLPGTPTGAARIEVSACMQRAAPALSSAVVPGGGIHVRLCNPNTGCSLPASYLAWVTTAAAAPAVCLDASVVLLPDRFPVEMGFRLEAPSSNGTLATVLLAGGVGTFETRVCGPLAQPLTLVLTDEEGDGFCCKFGNGSFALRLNGTLVAAGGAFTGHTLLVPTRLAPHGRVDSLAPGGCVSMALAAPPGLVGNVTISAVDIADTTLAPSLLTTTVSNSSASGTRTASVSRSVTLSRTRSVTLSRTRSVTLSTTPSRTRSVTVSATRSGSTLAATPTRTRTATLAATPSRTRSFSMSQTCVCTHR